jgi:hypothetical protein
LCPDINVASGSAQQSFRFAQTAAKALSLRHAHADCVGYISAKLIVGFSALLSSASQVHAKPLRVTNTLTRQVADVSAKTLFGGDSSPSTLLCASHGVHQGEIPLIKREA